MDPSFTVYRQIGSVSYHMKKIVVIIKCSDRYGQLNFIQYLILIQRINHNHIRCTREYRHSGSVNHPEGSDGVIPLQHLFLSYKIIAVGDDTNPPCFNCS